MHSRKTISRRQQAQNRTSYQLPDPMNLEPDALRDIVRSALSRLTVDELASWREHLLSGLRMAGVNLNTCRFLIGISVDSPDTLTPSGIAHLIRYVRLNLPEAMKLVAGQLDQLLAINNTERKSVV